MNAAMCRERAANVRLKSAYPRLLINLAATVLAILAIAIIFIRLEPFDDRGLHNLLSAEECQLPCFMGIRPNITTATQAYDLLQQQGLVSKWIEPPHPLEQIGDDSGFGLLRWRWSHKRPTPLSDVDGSLVYNRKTGLIITFGPMGTHLSLGEALIILGQPLLGYMSGSYNDRGGPIFTHVIGYSQPQVSLVSSIQCPMTVRELWAAPVALQIAPTDDQTTRFTPYPAHIQAILGYAAYTFC